MTTTRSSSQPEPDAAGQLISCQATGPVTTITLDSPRNANALSGTLLRQLRHALGAALADPAVRVITLTGSGAVFCSGADLTEALAGPARTSELMSELLQLLWDSPKPVLCRVNGSARAGGIGLVAACDIAIAPERATFAFPEVRIGVAPAMIAVPCLRRMSARAAAEFFLTGEVFGASRAAQAGLITRAVSAQDLDGEVSRYQQLLLRAAPGALAAAKHVLRTVPALGVADGLAQMAELSAALFGSAEAQEGMTAFGAKREPSWVIQPGGRGR